MADYLRLLRMCYLRNHRIIDSGLKSDDSKAEFSQSVGRGVKTGLFLGSVFGLGVFFFLRTGPVKSPGVRFATVLGVGLSVFLLAQVSNYRRNVVVKLQALTRLEEEKLRTLCPALASYQTTKAASN